MLSVKAELVWIPQNCRAHAPKPSTQTGLPWAGLAAGGLKAVGKGLDAAESVARAFGLKSHAERRSAAAASSATAAAPIAAALAVSTGQPAVAEDVAPDDVAAADARLLACIAEAEVRVLSMHQKPWLCLVVCMCQHAPDR